MNEKQKENKNQQRLREETLQSAVCMLFLVRIVCAAVPSLPSTDCSLFHSVIDTIQTELCHLRWLSVLFFCCCCLFLFIFNMPHRFCSTALLLLLHTHSTQYILQNYRNMHSSCEFDLDENKRTETTTTKKWNKYKDEGNKYTSKRERELRLIEGIPRELRKQRAEREQSACRFAKKFRIDKSNPFLLLAARPTGRLPLRQGKI